MKTDREIIFVGDPTGKFNFHIKLELDLMKICVSVANFPVGFVIFLAVFVISLTVSH